MKTLYLECRMGAAGDMLLSALYELLDHAGKQKFLDAMNGLGLPGVHLEPEHPGHLRHHGHPHACKNPRRGGGAGHPLRPRP